MDYAQESRNDEIRRLREVLDESGKRVWSFQKLADKYQLSLTRVVHICKPETQNIKKYLPQSTRFTSSDVEKATRADQLRAMLIEAGLTQYRLAKLAGTTYSTVNRWAVGQATVPPLVLRYLQLLAAYKKDTKIVRDLRLEDDEVSTDTFDYRSRSKQAFDYLSLSKDIVMGFDVTPQERRSMLVHIDRVRRWIRESFFEKEDDADDLSEDATMNDEALEDVAN